MAHIPPSERRWNFAYSGLILISSEMAYMPRMVHLMTFVHIKRNHHIGASEALLIHRKDVVF